MPILPQICLGHHENGKCVFFNTKKMIWSLLVLILISGGVNASIGLDGINVVNGIIKYYIILGVVSVFFYWMAWTCWLIAGERQVRRIR